MYKFYFILIKLIKSNNKLNLLSNISIFISTLIASIILPLILSIENGYEQNILTKIINFDGYARIYKNINTKDVKLDEVNKNLFDTDEINSNSQYSFIENNYIISNTNNSEAITYTAINNLNEYINKNTNSIIYEKLNNEGIYIGIDLYKKLFINDNIIQTYIYSKDGDIYPLEIKGVFKTNIPLYDKYTILSSISFLNNITNNKFDLLDGYIIQDNNINLQGNNNIIFYNDKYREFINWLSSYKIPIYILIFFIILIMIINNSSSYFIDIINRKKNTHILNNIGLTITQIHLLYLVKYILLILFSTFVGSIICLILFYLQINYNLISLSSEIYYSDTLLLFISYKYFLYIPIILVFHSIYLYFASKKDFYSAL